MPNKTVEKGSGLINQNENCPVGRLRQKRHCRWKKELIPSLRRKGREIIKKEYFLTKINHAAVGRETKVKKNG
jgi:hypothetical protein